MKRLRHAPPAVTSQSVERCQAPGISAEALFDIEHTLSEPRFFGVPIGSTLGDIYYLDLFLGRLRLTPIEVCRDLLRYVYHWLRKPRAAGASHHPHQGRILFTWVDEKPDCRDLVLPIVNALQPDRCSIIGRSASMKTYLHPGIEFIPWNELPAIDFRSWRKEYDRCAPVWHAKLRRKLKQHRISQAVLPHLADAMLVQSQKVMASMALLDRLAPSAVVTEYDRGSLTSPLILSAQKRGLPTMTMIHGVINPPYGYVPLLADLAFCWGERHRNQMIELGTAPERLAITGCQRLNRAAKVDARATRTRLGFPAAKPMVLLATNPILPEHKLQLARVFCQAFAGEQEILAVVRLHQSEKLAEYEAVAADFPSVTFLANDAWSVDEALATADIVVCHDSGLGNDALVKRKLAVVLDALPVPLRNGRELVAKAGCPLVQSGDELAKIVKRLVSDDQLRQELHRRAEEYVRYFCADFAAQAALNAAQIIEARAFAVTPSKALPASADGRDYT